MVILVNCHSDDLALGKYVVVFDHLLHTIPYTRHCENSFFTVRYSVFLHLCLPLDRYLYSHKTSPSIKKFCTIGPLCYYLRQ